jgi:hypothetical protein
MGIDHFQHKINSKLSLNNIKLNYIPILELKKTNCRFGLVERLNRKEISGKKILQKFRHIV